MSSLLVPIAISSQLDVTGEERIHAASSVGIGTTRAAYLNITGDLVDGLVGDTGTYQYSIASAASPYVVTVLSGALPTGAGIDSQGLVTYEYSLAGSYSWELEIEDSVGNTRTLADSAVIAPMTMTGDVPDGLVGDDIDEDYVAVGGVLPLTFTVTSGTLPPGLVLNSSTGNIAGEYTTGGTYSWQVTVTDDAGNTAVVSDGAVVTPALAILGFYGDGEIGTPYSDTILGVNGTPPYTAVSIISGSLPPGLSIALDGADINLTGDPE
jgi:hypothetical protein